MKQRAGFRLYLILAFAVYEFAGLMSVHAAEKKKVESGSEVANVGTTERFDEKTVPWNATLGPLSGVSSSAGRQLDVVVDLHNISPLQIVKNLSVTVEFFDGKKSLGVATFEFPGGLIFGGKKIEHLFPIKDPKYLRPGVTMKPLHFDGSIDTHVLTDKMTIEKALGKA